MGKVTSAGNSTPVYQALEDVLDKYRKHRLSELEALESATSVERILGKLQAVKELQRSLRSELSYKAED